MTEVDDKKSRPFEFLENEAQTKRVKNISSDSLNENSADEDVRLQKIADAYRVIIECLGEDPNREGIESTPMRAAKAMAFFTKGYTESPEEVVGEGIFNEDTQSDMVLVRNIDIHSMCEHHMVPFSGKVHIAYIPNGKILGLSKLARIADVYSRRMQVQERLTRQIAQAIQDLTGCIGVGVVVEASHLCMVMRGVEKAGSSTITSTLLGNFKTDLTIRKEFFALVNQK